MYQFVLDEKEVTTIQAQMIYGNIEGWWSLSGSIDDSFMSFNNDD